jgi:hypothetical protein
MCAWLYKHRDLDMCTQEHPLVSKEKHPCTHVTQQCSRLSAPQAATAVPSAICIRICQQGTWTMPAACLLDGQNTTKLQGALSRCHLCLILRALHSRVFHSYEPDIQLQHRQAIDELGATAIPAWLQVCMPSIWYLDTVATTCAAHAEPHTAHGRRVPTILSHNPS